jgi:hypothetical protein
MMMSVMIIQSGAMGVQSSRTGFSAEISRFGLAQFTIFVTSTLP